MPIIASLFVGSYDEFLLEGVYKLSKGEKIYDTDGHIKRFFDEEIKGQISKTLTYKGNLRISWDYSVNYNKHIDLIFFTEKNPYMNYVVLYGADVNTFLKNERQIREREFYGHSLKSPLDNEFAKKVLNEYGGEKAVDEFFKYRFGSVNLPMEITFEWAITGSLDFSYYDEYLNDMTDEYDELSGLFCVGTIKSYKLLPKGTKLNIDDYGIGSCYADEEECKKETRYRKELKEAENTSGLMYYHFYATPSQVFSPLPTNALLKTRTKPNDFYVNLRESPSSDSKILAQLFSKRVGNGIHYDEKDNRIPHPDDVESQNIAQLKLYNKNKAKMTNPLFVWEYDILLKEILPNNWCRVDVLKPVETYEIDIYDIRTYIKKDFIEKYQKNPKFYTLFSGYIHSSGLEYYLKNELNPNYIRI